MGNTGIPLLVPLGSIVRLSNPSILKRVEHIISLKTYFDRSTFVCSFHIKEFNGRTFQT